MRISRQARASRNDLPGTSCNGGQGNAEREDAASRVLDWQGWALQLRTVRIIASYDTAQGALKRGTTPVKGASYQALLNTST